MKKNNELLRALTLKDAVGVGLGAIIGAGYLTFNYINCCCGISDRGKLFWH